MKRLYFAIMSVVCFFSVFSGCTGLTSYNGAVTAAGRGSHRQHPRRTGMKI
ncbi:MAG: hypothetical protein II428_02340 [Muribaculaceae bacterium]|nr:hypothetical protein [Muribaculaceae bacterium]